MQARVVDSLLGDLEVAHIPILTVWNKVDRLVGSEVTTLAAEAQDRSKRGSATVLAAAGAGIGLGEVRRAMAEALAGGLVTVELLVPFDRGDVLAEVRRLGVVRREAHGEGGTELVASVPLVLARRLAPMRDAAARAARAGELDELDDSELEGGKI